MRIPRFSPSSFLVFLALAPACADRSIELGDEVAEQDQNPFEPSEQYSDCVEGFECMNEWCLSPVDEPGFCTIGCADVEDCEVSAYGTAVPTCLAIGSEAACALDCGDGRTCPPGMRCEKVDIEGERSICF